MHNQPRDFNRHAVKKRWKTHVKKLPFFGWKYCHYFTVVEEGEKNIKVRCSLCVGNKTLSCARNTTSNFKKHLTTVHKHITLVAKEVYNREDSSHGGTGAITNDNSDINNPQKRQRTLSLSPGSSNRDIPPTKLRSLLAEYVIEDMLPLSTVESHAFRKLLNSLCSTQIPDRKSFTDHLDHQYDLVVQKVKSSLASVEHVSTTADVWTGHNRSYLGMTVHWIDPATLERRKAAISCCRVTGRHTYDVLASKIESVHTNYGLLGKITATVTDNGSNFVKAFSMFQSSPDSMEMTSSLPPPPSMEDDSEEGMDLGETNFEDMDDLLGKGQNSTKLTNDDMIVSMIYHLMKDVQPIPLIWLLLPMSVNIYCHPRPQKVCTEAHFRNVQHCGIKQAGLLSQLITSKQFLIESCLFQVQHDGIHIMKHCYGLQKWQLWI